MAQGWIRCAAAAGAYAQVPDPRDENSAGGPAPAPEHVTDPASIPAHVRVFLEKLQTACPGPIRLARSRRYVLIGQAGDPLWSLAARSLDRLYDEFVTHFSQRGFDLQLPKDPLPVILLPDRAAFETLAGNSAQGNYGGLYRLDLGCLVVHDQSENGKRLESAQAAHLRNLSHEGTHQLCYRSGMLTAGRDIPLAIAEGLAVYGESYQTEGHHALGQLNRPRFDLLYQRDGRKAPWIPFEQLLANDGWFRTGDDPTRASVAYAQSWLLIHYLLNVTPLVPRFRAYLSAIAKRSDASRRIEDVRRYLGDPRELGTRVRNHGLDLPRYGRSQYQSTRRSSGPSTTTPNPPAPGSRPPAP
jgi:hypothetical protein